MKRLYGWDIALVQYCDAVRKHALEYGLSDCIMFSAGGVEVQTGIDLGAPHRGKYSSPEEAEAYMRANGWEDVHAIVDTFLPRVDLAHRRRGDVLGFCDGPAGKSVGICLGRSAMVMSPIGAAHYSSAKASIAWRVGDDA